MSPLSKKGLGYKFIKLLVIVVLVSTLVPSLYGLLLLFKTIYGESSRKLASDLEIASLLLDKKKSAIEEIAVSLSKDRLIRKMVEYRLGNPLRIRLLNFLEGFSNTSITSLTVTDKDGIVLFRSREIFSTGDSLKNESVVSKALEGKKIITFSTLYCSKLNKDGFKIKSNLKSLRSHCGIILKVAIPILFSTGTETTNEQDETAFEFQNKVVGTIIANYLLNEQSELLEEINSRTGAMVNISLGNVIINSTNENFIGKVLNLSPDTIKKIEKEKKIIKSFPRQNKIGGYLPLYDINKKRIGLIELISSTLPILHIWNIAFWNYILFLLLGLFSALVIGYLMTIKITEPIHKLMEGTKEMAKGNLTFKIKLFPYSDEINMLADAFNEMGAKLYESIENIKLSRKNLEDYSEKLKTAHLELANHSQELETVNQKLLESNIKLIKANEVKDTFLSTVSHELKTPLTTIIGYSSMLIQETFGKLNEDQRISLEIISRRAKNLESLISDLLNLSRIDAGKLELRRHYVEIEKEIRTVEEIFKEKLTEKLIEFKIEIPKNFPRIYADSERLLQVMTNLISNAIKFTPQNGKILVTAVVNSNYDFVQIDVKDTGIGIPKDELEHIFDRFYQIDKKDGREYGGTGLGLAIAKELIELHGGKIWAENNIELGSTFHFTLPIGEI